MKRMKPKKKKTERKKVLKKVKTVNDYFFFGYFNF